MSGEILLTTGTRKRPSWKHSRITDTSFPGAEYAQLEMLESIRNVMEEIKGSQMLQCDVAQAIKGMHEETRRTRLILARMDRRLAKVEKLK